MKTNQKGFTLIELLVVISIIAVLAAILFPVFARAREKARQSTCTSNQRQIAAAAMMFAQDHDETLPATGTVWSDLNLEAGILVCPTKGKATPNGYGYFYARGGQAIGAITDPTKAVLTADADTADHSIIVYKQFAYRHSDRTIASFADGHVDISANPPADDLIPTNGMLTWLRADDLNANGAFNDNPADNTSVAKWNDYNHSAYNWAQSTATLQPKYRPGQGPNGMPAVVFDGVDDAMYLADLDYKVWTVIVVGKAPSGAATGWVFSDYGASKNSLAAMWRDNATGNMVVYGRDTTGANFTTATTANSFSNFGIRSMWNTNKSVYYREVSATSAFSGQSTPNPAYVESSLLGDSAAFIGNSTWGSHPANLYLSELLVYTRLLTQEERTGIETYLKAKYFSSN